MKRFERMLFSKKRIRRNVEEENRRLSGIQQLTEQEQQEEIKKREKNKAYQLHKEFDDYEQAKKDLEDAQASANSNQQEMEDKLKN